ncbi:tRNA threonylcarbamoyladenosine dehydratase [Anaeromicropila populeti]|uniref:tRNA A37 threonylcarbamoyladenosine dehydratase n=1 Tax=Anaeromicropila populeti TaxID=37658 RepID=A0A1I6KPZ8_9FIRM|nr:tRNA threonylcarbamoyladenosine dehydratase [Anaeromicropila populeti]SFR93274.1 tRNA A37 threonylcarbamoyladenosine dehydratase [Anaeromicropila populeti]
MVNQFSRSELLFGADGMQRLYEAKVLVFGIGGVGGYVVEALARSGIGRIDIVDNDVVSLTNLNRQIIATNSTIGKYKVDVMKERILEINSNAVVNTYPCFYLPENAKEFNFSEYDYIVDAIDTVTAKIDIVVKGKEFNVPVISCMGAGNKMNPSSFEVADIYETSICPLAKVMRRELKKRNIDKLKVVYSKEVARKTIDNKSDEVSNKRAIPGSNAFVPAAAGLIVAGEVVKDISGVR